MTIRPRLWYEVETDITHCDGAGGNDYTLCGVALDNDQTTTEEVKTGRITCGQCLAVIDFCKSISRRVLS